MLLNLLYIRVSAYISRYRKDKKKARIPHPGIYVLFCRRKFQGQRLELPSRPLTEVVKSDSSLLGLQNRLFVVFICSCYALICVFLIHI